jgi:hypothetical protein
MCCESDEAKKHVVRGRVHEIIQGSIQAITISQTGQKRNGTLVERKQQDSRINLDW